MTCPLHHETPHEITDPVLCAHGARTGGYNGPLCSYTYDYDAGILVRDDVARWRANWKRLHGRQKEANEQGTLI